MPTSHRAVKTISDDERDKLKRTRNPSTSSFPCERNKNMQRANGEGVERPIDWLNQLPRLRVQY